MRLHVLYLLYTLLPSCIATHELSDVSLPCADSAPSDHDDTCQTPLADVTAVVPGSFYLAKLPCLDCPTVRYAWEGSRRIQSIVNEDNHLLFNVSVSNDGTALLLNNKPIFPSPPVVPAPLIYAHQVPTNFSRADLERRIKCASQGVNTGRDCWALGAVSLDYDYGSRQRDWAEDKIVWEVTFDAIGGYDGHQGDPVWSFNHTNQLMVKIVVSGVPIDDDEYLDEYQTASTLFDVPDAQPERRFDLTIGEVMLVTRSYTFPMPRTRNPWEKLVYWLAGDAPRKDGHLVFLQQEWGLYGKKGTLKDALGQVWNDWPWELVLIIVGSVCGGLLVLYGTFRLVKVGIQQHKLSRWQGMDDVWAEMRRERAEEDEEGLLDGDESRYRDEPTPRLTNEYMRSKPLPSKPLPEKPLPEVPLLDDI